MTVLERSGADIVINLGGGSLVSDAITLTPGQADAAWGKLMALMEDKLSSDRCEA